MNNLIFIFTENSQHSDENTELLLNTKQSEKSTKKEKQNKKNEEKRDDREKSSKSEKKDDFDEILKEFEKTNYLCSFDGCQKSTKLIKLVCEFCKKWFCLEHGEFIIIPTSE